MSRHKRATLFVLALPLAACWGSSTDVCVESTERVEVVARQVDQVVQRPELDAFMADHPDATCERVASEAATSPGVPFEPGPPEVRETWECVYCG